MSFWNRRRSLETASAHQATLKPTLTWLHLIGLGVGGIVGTGILTLTGVGAGLAGPGVILSFVIAGVVCACAALAYAEMATMIPMAGSAYTYTYVALGELLAWFVGWSLILEYTVVCSAVAVGWSGYAAGVFQSLHWNVPHALLAGPSAGGIINLPAVFISLFVAGVLAIGTRESATVNVLLVMLKLIALVVFIVLALPAFDATRFQPFMPFGFQAHEVDGVNRGVMAAASVVFFAFYGFDAVSTAAEETKRPGRDLTIGIVGSMLVCTLLYMGVSAAALGGSNYEALAKSGEPLAFVLRSLDHPRAAVFLGAVAVIALPTVIMAFMYGQSRVFFAMARDGLLPKRLSSVHARFGTPLLMTLVTGIFVAVIAGLLPLTQIVELANAGTLIAFIAVAICMVVMRSREADRPRMFRVPIAPVVACIAVGGCAYLFWSLPTATKIRFLVWNVIGIGVYLLYARRKSLLEQTTPP